MKINSKLISLSLMILGVVFFIVFLWWSANYHHLNTGYSTGIWMVAVGTFLTGAITFFKDDINNQ